MRPAAAEPARQSCAGTRSLLSSLASADDGGSENAARAGVTEARHESDLAVEKDETRKPWAARRCPTRAYAHTSRSAPTMPTRAASPSGQLG